MENRANYILLGIFVIVFFLAAAGFVLWLGKFADNSDYKFYRINTKESISGLNKKAPVKLLGVHVGEVTEVFINSDNPEEVSIIIKVDEKTPVTVDTEATVELQGITGLKFVQLQGGTNESIPLSTSDEIPKMAIIQNGESLLSNIDKITKDSGNLLGDISSVANKLNHTLSQKNINNLEEILENLANFTSSLNQISEQIQSSINSVSQTTAKMNQNFTSTTDKISQASDSFSNLMNNKAEEMISSVKETAISISNLMNKLQSSLLSIETQGDGAIDSTKTTIDEAKLLMLKANELIEQLQNSPSDILYKNTPEKLGPGERE